MVQFLICWNNVITFSRFYCIVMSNLMNCIAYMCVPYSIIANLFSCEYDYKLTMHFVTFTSYYCVSWHPPCYYIFKDEMMRLSSSFIVMSHKTLTTCTISSLNTYSYCTLYHLNSIQILSQCNHEIILIYLLNMEGCW